jgi:hypothetical protein
VERPGPVDRNGPCANSLPQDDIKQDSLPAGWLPENCYTEEADVCKLSSKSIFILDAEIRCVALCIIKVFWH